MTWTLRCSGGATLSSGCEKKNYIIIKFLFVYPLKKLGTTSNKNIKKNYLFYFQAKKKAQKNFELKLI